MKVAQLEGVTEDQIKDYDIIQVGNTIFYNERFCIEASMDYIKKGGKHANAFTEVLNSSKNRQKLN